MINISKASVSFNRQEVLYIPHFHLKPLEFWGVIGPNGGGKTTFLNILLGIIPIQNGLIRVFNKKPSQSRHLIGYVPQYSSFNTDFPIDVLSTVLMGLHPQKILNQRFNSADYDKALDTLKRVGLSGKESSLIGHLSGGERQRVMIARALIRQPQLLLLDEPASNLDVRSRHQVYEILHNLKSQLSMIIVSHDIGIITTHVDHIACLNKTLTCHARTQLSEQILSQLYHCPIDLFSSHTHSTCQEDHHE